MEFSTCASKNVTYFGMLMADNVEIYLNYKINHTYTEDFLLANVKQLLAKTVCVLVCTTDFLNGKIISTKVLYNN